MLSFGRRIICSASIVVGTRLLARQQKISISFPSISVFNFSERNITMSSTLVETDTKEVEPAFQRLPSCVVPKHYTLELQPNLVTFQFEGQEVIDVAVKEETAQVLLNAADLSVSKAIWNGQDGINQEAVVTVNAKQEILTLLFEPPLKPSSGTLSIQFTGELNDKMRGFYRSKYRDANGVDRFNAVTQFEATDARRCFPCWDEPAIKATFDVSLIVPKDKVALSNMPVKKTTEHPTDLNLNRVDYERTPIMSTYLVAFVVGDFDYVEARSSDNVLCRVYTPPGKKEQGRFALDVTVRVLPYYKEYFGLAYPLPKMDLIAIADFASGAMENWGLITYRETCLLVDESNTSATNKQWIAIVVGHEIAHQWFGNLVTMEWWTHLWLNEGYASFVEFLCVDHLFPEYDIWTQFVTDTYIRALELDALESSHPIEVPVQHPSEIDEIFDDISYSKGAAVIRMLHDYIGINDFKRGMNLYLTRHQYGNAYTEDLWRALEEASGKPVAAVMSTWTRQMGFPLISVTAKQVGNNRVLTLTQEKYSSSPALRGSDPSQNYSWLIPLTFSSSKNPGTIAHEVLMDKKTMEVTLEVEESDWVKLNPGTVGYYRVRYTPEMLQQLIPAIREKSIPPLDRLGILDDLYSLVQSGQCSTVDMLKVLEAFIEEEVYTVWSSISNILGKLNVLASYTDDHEAFKAYGRRIFSRITEKIGWEPKENETHLQTLLRSLVLNRMVTFDNKDVIEEAKLRFKAHVNGEKIIPADLRSCVYKAVLSAADENVYELMLKLYREADIMEEKDRIARALGSMKDAALLQKVLEFSLSDDVRSQDTIFVIIAVGMSKLGRDLAWNFFQSRIKTFKTRYLGGQMVSRIVKYVTENFVTEEKATEVENFFKENKYPGTERTVQQSVESIRVNEAWMKRDQEHIQAYLKSVV